MRLLFFIAAGIVACVAGQSCIFTGNNENKRLISCSAVNADSIDLHNDNIDHLNADAFDNNTNLLSL